MAFNVSSSTTLSPTDSTPLAPAGRHHAHSMLSSSISSLSSSGATRHGGSLHISKSYRQASSLFLTRRLPEALSTVLPLITAPTPDPVDGIPEPPPVARTSRNTRIKVWSLYLTILNGIADLSPDEGKAAFGTQEWRALTSKVRDGQIWEEVADNGYHGVEGDVDPEVVINLATLLLAHAQTQTVNQQRLEAYLSCFSQPTFDVTKHMEKNARPRRIAPKYQSPARGPSGADTPRDLNARVKILELYTLHVLIRNDEWEYARDFISGSSILDDERREAFLQALTSLQEDQQAESLRQAEVEQAERAKQEEAERQAKAQEEKERKEKQAAQREEARILAASEANHEQRPSTSGSTGSSSSKKLSRKASKAAKGSSSSSSHKGKHVTKATVTPPAQTSLATRAALVLSNIGTAVEGLGASLRTNPVAVLRVLGFIVGILLVLGRKDVRRRLARMLGSSWTKVLATAGMGTKVSYI